MGRLDMVGHEGQAEKISQISLSRMSAVTKRVDMYTHQHDQRDQPINDRPGQINRADHCSGATGGITGITRYDETGKRPQEEEAFNFHAHYACTPVHLCSIVCFTRLVVLLAASRMYVGPCVDIV